jgi:uncharacterized protein YdeI (YjbR/CyaY-like superfamily)
LNEELQAATGLVPGAAAEVTIEPVEAAATADAVPADLADAVTASAAARSFFDQLSAFYRNQYIGWIASAKRAETRQARVAEVVELLEAGVKQRR